MRIERWDPFREVVSLRDAMNSLLSESFVRPGGLPAPEGPAVLPLDVAEKDGEFVIKASLPGVAPGDVQITVHGDTLTIRGGGESKSEEESKDARWHLRERRVGSFERFLNLGFPIDADTAVAHFDRVVLTLTLPRPARSSPRQIKVAGASAPSPSVGCPVAPDRKPVSSGTAGHDPADQPQRPGGKPEPTHDRAAELARERHEAETARNAQASNRDRMVDIGRGNQQAEPV
jgi:HSP20 family protein